jgi:Cof subfamily protein (haloacid dehalogenase superfamily)
MNERKEIKLIAVDVDGTLLNSKSELTGRTESALRKAIEQGVQIVLATGKSRNSTAQIIEKLNLNTHGIYLQGLAVYKGDGSVHWQQTLDPALARQVITFAEDRGFTLIAYSGMRIMVRAMNQDVEDALVKYHEPLPDVVGPLQNVVGDMPIHKLMAVGEPRGITSLRWHLNLQIGSGGRLMQAGLPQMLEILPPNGSKGAALKMLLKDLRIPAENVLAIGDAENDIEMLQLGGIGVAMGHAGEKVKEAADHVVASNDEDGVAEAIERFVLPPEPPAAEDKPSPAEAAETKSEATETPK